MTKIHLTFASLLALGVLASSAGSALAAKQYVPGASFGARGSAAGELLEPQGVAVDEATGDVYVADMGNRRIDEFTAGGAFMRAWGWGVAGGVGFEACGPQALVATCQQGLSGSNPGELESPTYVAVDNSAGPSKGDLYVGDSGDGTVTKFSEAGALIESWGVNGQLTEREAGKALGEVDGVAVDGAGDLWVYAEETLPGKFEREQPEAEVDEFTDAGVFEPAASFKTGTIEEVGLVFPRRSTHIPSDNLGALAVDSAGSVYLSDNQLVVLKYETGAVVSEFAKTPEALAINHATDELLVSEGANTQNHSVIDIQLYPPFAEPDSPVETLSGEGLSESNGIAVDGALSTYTLYVTQLETGRVLTYDFVQLPVAGTEAATEVTPHGATLNGTVQLEGAGPATCSFAWGETEALGHEAPCPATVSSETQQVHVPVELQSGTAYYYRLQATNANGTKRGAIEHFTTLGPRIAAESITAVNDEDATLAAELDPNGAQTTYRFEYGAGSVSEHQTAEATLGFVDDNLHAVDAEVQGLTPGTTYQYRVVTSNTSETEEIYGPDETFTTQTANTELTLPDGRAYEMVSPPEKLGASITTKVASPTAADAAAGGGAFTFLTLAPTEFAPAGYLEEEQVLAHRSAGGWESRDLGVPHEVAESNSGGYGPEYRLFSSELTSAIVQPFGYFTPCVSARGISQPCLSPAASEQTPFVDDLQAGVFTPLVTGCPPVGTPCAPAVQAAADVPAGTIFGGVHGGGQECGGGTKYYCGPLYVAATPDLSHVLVYSETGLTAGEGAAGGLYEFSAGKLTFVGKTEEPPDEQGNSNGEYAAHVGRGFSEDGSRVIFGGAVGGVHGLWLRDTQSGEAIRLGEGEFQSASVNDSRVFFDAGWGGELEVWEQTSQPGEPLAGSVTDLTEGKGMRGLVLGSSVDGSYVYFVSNGVLAGSGAGTPGDNLYVDRYDVETGRWAPTFIAALSSEDHTDWQEESKWGGTYVHEQPARVSPNGRWLAFMSQAPLTGYDNHEVKSGQPVAEVYLYHAGEGGAPTLNCASCMPSGARPVGVELYESEGMFAYESFATWPEHALVAASVPGWEGLNIIKEPPEPYQPRYLSNSGRVFFNSIDPLVPLDMDGTQDVYEYEPEGVPAGKHACASTAQSGSEVFKPAHSFTAEVEGIEEQGEEGAGCVALISSGNSDEESVFLDASETGGEGSHGEQLEEGGGDVFFMTTAKLAPQDVGNEYDVYDAHECTTQSPCSTPSVGPAICETEASCKPSPEPQPSIYGAGPSETFSGPGNLGAPPPPPVTKAVVKPLTKAQKLTAALKQCKKDKQKRRRAKCEKQARSKYRAANRAKAKKTSNGKGRA